MRIFLTRLFGPLFLALLFVLAGCQDAAVKPNPVEAAKIDRAANEALHNLYAETPSAKVLAKGAKGILVFPNMVKGGFIGGVQYGTGALRENNQTTGYYNLVAGSVGLQVGAQSFNYVMFFMTDSALNYLHDTEGFELGVGPSFVMMDEGLAKNLTSSTAQDDIYGFVFGQRGLMAGVGIEGSKITPINP